MFSVSRTGDNVFHSLSDGVPKGIRTPVTAVKGQCPRPLDDGDTKIATESVIQYFCVKVRMWQHIRTTDAVKTRYRTFTAQSSPSSTGALAHLHSSDNLLWTLRNAYR